MDECEFKKECGELKHEYGDCVLIEPPPLNSKTDCEHYQFAILVRNKALWIAQKEIQLADCKADAIGRVEALKMEAAE